MFVCHFSLNILDDECRKETPTKAISNITSPSIAIIIVINSVFKLFDIKRILKDPKEPLPIAIVNKLKVGERSSGDEFKYIIVLWRAE